MNSPKNKTSVRESAFFTPRTLVGCGFGAMAVALTVLAFFAIPKHAAMASHGYCSDVEMYPEYTGESGVAVDMDSNTLTDDKFECIVFFTTDGTNPTHFLATPTGTTSRFYAPVPVPPMQCRHFRARGWLSGYTDSQNITDLVQCAGNP